MLELNSNSEVGNFGCPGHRFSINNGLECQYGCKSVGLVLKLHIYITNTGGIIERQKINQQEQTKEK